MAAILPLVKKYDAAIIALPNDHDEIPMEADKRLVLTEKIIRVATQEYGIAQADIVIDPLAMPIGADTGTSLVTIEMMRRIRDEFGVNMTCGASNVSFGMPARHTLNSVWLPMAMTAGLTSAIMDARTPQIVEAVKAADVFLGHDDWGMAWISAHRAASGCRAGRLGMTPGMTDLWRRARPTRVPARSLPPRGPDRASRAPSRPPTTAPAGCSCPSPSRTRRRRRPSAACGCRRVSASSTPRRGTASPSTPRAAATAPATSARCASTPATPVTRHDARTFNPAELEAGWRLACLVQATRDHDVVVPPLVTRPKAATVGVGRQVILRPAVQKRYVELAEPTLEDQRPDLVRLLDAIDDLEPVPDLHVLRRLPKVLREADFKVTAVVVDEALVDVEPGDTTGVRYAIAFDLGTTTVVATLLDLVTGTPVAVASMLNKQQPFGGDVISRISATMLDPAALGRLQQAAAADPVHAGRAGLPRGRRRPAARLRGGAGRQRHDDGAAARHRPRAARGGAVRADDRDAGRRTGERGRPRAATRGARVALFPALGAYVGGDIVAGMLATGMDRDKRIRLFIDVGTNCEIVLSDGERILSTAAPAGPAFEGGAIRCGMRAADGAIEVVKLTRRRVDRRRARRDRRRRARAACAAPAWSTPSPSWSRSACSTPAAATPPTRSPRRSRPGSPTG